MRVLELSDCILGVIFRAARDGDVLSNDVTWDARYCNLLAVPEVMEREKVLGNVVEMILKCQFP